MSEYWVSKKKYLCKYCDIYIADDAPSRQHHENGLRHKGNVERFIRGIYKAGEKQKKDLEEEKREMRRVEQAAAAAFAEDVGAGRAKAPPAPVASTSTAPKKPSTKPSNPYANYSTAESLGYKDPDAERLAAEAEIRRSQGIAGEWQILAPTEPRVGTKVEGDGADGTNGTAPGDAGVKREAEAPPDDEDTRAFKLRKKTLTRGLGEIYDPGVIPIKIKKKEETATISPEPQPNTSIPPEPETLKWKPTQWKRTGGNSQQTEDSGSQRTPDIKQEGDTSLTTIESNTSKWAKPQWSQPLPDFKQEEMKTIFGNQEVVEGANDRDKPLDPVVKTESDIIKEEPQTTGLSEAAPASTALFKKRKAPSGAGRGRREI
ncbi:WW domain-binding protein 4 [Psilocybe cubensis]|uniref:WW domain-binding protein 4 n=2 Tax=Psilocybe cubensis TaxID=181762 RepID=A0ACB8HAX0_PSICU|nr:WW domain-binding protein 4 [Psilocybe cubensis]KAH9484996.1 WW domain-binding protein 4 [Psilocybe cubensis]